MSFSESLYPRLFEALKATVRNDPFRGDMSETIIPSRFDALLRTRGNYEQLGFYESVERDAVASAFFSKRRQSVLMHDMQILAGGETPADEHAKEVIEYWWKNNAPTEILDTLLLGVLYGIYCVELVWRRDAEGLMLPAAWRGISPRRYRAEASGRIRILTQAQALHGEIFDAHLLLIHRHHAGGGEWPYGRGLAAELWWPIFFRKQVMVNWLQAGERFGSPAAHATTPAGAAEDVTKSVDEALDNLRQGGNARTPEGVELKLLEAAANTGQIFQQQINYIDRILSQRITQETLTSGEGEKGGTYAAAKVHNEVRHEVARYDAAMLAETIRQQLFAHILKINDIAGEVPHLNIVFDEPAATDVQLAQLKIAAELGYRPADGAEVLSKLLDIEMEEAPAPEPMPDDDDGDDKPAPASASGIFRHMATAMARLLKKRTKAAADLQTEYARAADVFAKRHSAKDAAGIIKTLEAAESEEDLIQAHDASAIQIGDDEEMLTDFQALLVMANLNARLPVTE